MQKELDGLKRQIAAFIDVIPELEAASAKLKRAGFGDVLRKPVPSDLTFAFSINLDVANDPDRVFELTAECPDGGQRMTFKQSLEHFRHQIEIFESLIAEFEKRGIAFGTKTFDRDPPECQATCTASNPVYTLKVTLAMTDAIWVMFSISTPTGEEVLFEADDPNWKICTDGWDEGDPLASLFDKLRPHDSMGPGRHADILDLMAEHFKGAT